MPLKQMLNSGYRRYEKLPNVENLEDYRPGGYHPVHPGDRLNAGKYLVINKLGYGDISSVWLAENTAQHNCVAISILKAESSHGDNLAGVEKLRYLSKVHTHHPGSLNVLLSRETFEISGPNGTHLCVMSPVQGPSIAAATKRSRGVASEVLPLKLAKRAALDVAQGLAYIHMQHVAHGDLHPGNILLGLPEAENWTSEKISLLSGPPKTLQIRRLDGIPIQDQDCAPRYAVEPAFAKGIDASFFSGPVKISDFGNAFFADNPPTTMADLGPYMVPEFCSPGKITLSVDIWMLGCLFFYLISGRDIFGAPDDPPEKVLSAMMETLGKPPEYLFNDWISKTSGCLDMNNTPSRPLPTLVQEIRDGNQALGIKGRQDELSTDDIEALTDLLMTMLVYEHDKRPSVETVLQHPAIGIFKR